MKLNKLSEINTKIEFENEKLKKEADLMKEMSESKDSEIKNSYEKMKVKHEKEIGKLKILLLL